MKSMLFRCLLTLSLFILPNTQLSSYELVVVSMFRNCAPYIKEWVEYHRLAGVDHFWLYDDASTDDWQSELATYIESGLVEVFYWPAGKPNWTGDQNRAFRDGLKRGVGVAKWVALLDSDEFILPLKNKSIPECLNQRFANEVAIYINWRHFGTSHVTLQDREPMLSRLTSCSNKSHPRNSVGKSILRPEYADIDQLWTQHFCPLIPGAHYVDGEGNQTMTFHGLDLISDDGRNHEGFIRINHYAHRDENYFWNVRLPRDSEKNLILEHYESFNIEKNFEILNFLKTYHQNEYQSYWLPYRTDRNKDR